MRSHDRGHRLVRTPTGSRSRAWRAESWLSASCSHTGCVSSRRSRTLKTLCGPPWVLPTSCI
ncbi:hypothetical protein EYF80_064554 [Liparis tanakae]|uniref:Uncharacterized protein n=1 Tax=Liparis tanakae TaxID=230148 RepID=A0A4Z2E950_9TELE|nr:hypothetical protein EYF80_064554 [Liparis tanakae]